jgi:excisionase family DNA binding protein
MKIRPRRAAAARPKRLNTIPYPNNARLLDAELVPLAAPTAPSLGRILEVHEIANRFHTHTETVKRKLREGKLRGFKFGKSWFMREADVQGYILDALESERLLRRREGR